MHKLVATSWDPKIIGVTNGISQIDLDRKNLLNEKGDNYKFYNFFNNFSFWQNQNESFDIDYLPLKAKKLKKAILTDFMGYGPSIMAFTSVFSKNFYDLVKDFNIGQHKLFEVIVEDTSKNYYFIYLESILNNKIIFEKSNIFTGHVKTDDYKSFKVTKYEEYLELNKVNPLIQFDKIAIDKKYEIFDIISLQSSTGLFFSEKLIKRMEQANITGYTVKENIKLEFY